MTPVRAELAVEEARGEGECELHTVPVGNRIMRPLQPGPLHVLASNSGKYKLSPFLRTPTSSSLLPASPVPGQQEQEVETTSGYMSSCELRMNQP